MSRGGTSTSRWTGCFPSWRAGGSGMSWYPDPAGDLHAILLTGVARFPGGIYEAFWTSVYQAIDD